MAKTLDEIFGAPAAPTAPAATNQPKSLDDIFARPAKAAAARPVMTSAAATVPVPKKAPNQEWETTKGIMSSAAHAINKGYEAFTQLPVIKQFAQATGAVVGTAGSVIGTGVELMGAPVTEAIAMKKGATMGQAVGKVWDGVKKQWVKQGEQADELGVPTAGQMGTSVGEAAAPAALTGAAGRVLNLALAFGQGYTGYEDVRDGLKEKDWAKVTQGLSSLAVAGFSGVEGLKPGKGGILADPKFKRQLKAEVEGVRSVVTGDKRTPYTRAIDHAADTYQTVLNPTKAEMTKLELGKGKDVKQITRLMAEEGIPIGKNDSGKLDTMEAIEQVNSKMDEIGPTLDPILESRPEIQYNLNDVRKTAKERIDQMDLAALEKKARKADVDEIIDAEIEQRYGPDWQTEKVDPVVPAVDANGIKQGMWKMGYNAMKPTSNSTARQIGRIIKERIDEDFGDTAAPDINARISDLADAKSLLTNAHGRVIKGGQLGRMAAGLVGAVAGEGIPIPVVGPLIGKAAGEAVHSRMVDPTRVITKSLERAEKAKAQDLPPSILVPEVKTGEIAPVSKAELDRFEPKRVPKVMANKVERFARQFLKKNQDAIIDEIKAQPGPKVIDPDVFKSKIPEYNGTHSYLYHEASSDAAKYAFKRLLKEVPEKEVRFTAGGSGSGKSELILKTMKEEGFDGIVYDGTFDKYQSAIKKIKQAEAAGKKVTISYVLPDLTKAWEFVNERAKKTGRAVPREIFIETHKGAKNTIRKLAEKKYDIKMLSTVGLTKEQAIAKARAGEFVTGDKILDVLP